MAASFNIIPDHSKSAISNSSAPPSSSKSNNTQDTDTFGTILRSLEIGLDLLTDRVDSLVVSSILNPSKSNKDGQSRGQALDRRPLPLFGSHLRDLVRDQTRSACAFLDPRLAVPNQVIKLLKHVSSYIDTPDLFRKRAALSEVQELYKALELERGVPPTADISSVAIVLVQWLNQLPEPLFGYDHYEAIIACGQIEDEAQRVRNLRVLALDMPWYAKPLALRALALMHQCALPEHTVTNRLNLVAVALLATPWLLRPRPHSSALSNNAEDLQLSAASSGSSIVQFIITHQAEVLGGVFEELSAFQQLLTNKCSRVRVLQQDLAHTPNLAELIALEDERVTKLLADLWNALEPADRRILVASPKATEHQSATFQLLQDDRWKRCNLCQDGEALKPFSSRQGLVALDGLLGFLQTYGDKAAAMVCDFASHRAQHCSLPQLVMRATHYVADVLQLLPPAGTSSTGTSQRLAPLQLVARHPSWCLLNDPRCFQELFDLAMLCFDDSWKNLTERVGELPAIDTYSQALLRTRRTLSELLLQQPACTSLPAVWEKYFTMKLMAEEALFSTRPAAQRLVQKHSSAEYLSRQGQSSHSNEVLPERVQLSSEHPDPHLRGAKPARSRSNTMNSAGSSASESQLETATTTAGGADLPLPTSQALGINRYVGSTSDNDVLNAKVTAAMEVLEMAKVWKKLNAGVATAVNGASKVLSPRHVDQLEAVST
jgi:hypothetical protein